MGALQLAAAIGIAPPPSQLLAAIIQQIQTAAPGVVAIISFIENIAGITTYFPGLIAILVAMSATAGSPIHAVRVFVAIVIGAGLAHILDFMIGRWTAGTSLRREVSRLDIWGGVATYWHPQLAAIFSVQKGAAGLSNGAFARLLLATWLPWNIFWGCFMYTVGRIPLSVSSWEKLLALYCVAWLGYEIYRGVLSA